MKWFNSQIDNVYKEQSLNVVERHVVNGKVHRDYEHVVKLACEYRDIFTGIGIGKYIKRFKKREDEAMFLQRIEIFESTISSTVSAILQTFNKALRSNAIIESFSHKDNKKHTEIKERYDDFYYGDLDRGVSAYLQDKYRYYATYDPNAYLCVEFADFDANKEKARAFPLEYTSDEVIDFEYKNGKLKWLLARKEHYFKCEKGLERGYKYYYYIGEYCYTFTQVDNVLRFIEDTTGNEEFVTFTDGNKKGVNKTFAYNEFFLGSKEVPLMRFGYLTDAITENRTCVSILHGALPYFKKELKTGSEFDLTMSMHVFPQKIQYGQICSEKGCNNGVNDQGATCKKCQGSGLALPVSTTTQDVLFVRPPLKDGDPILDLDKAVVYKSPDISIVKFQHEYQERLIELAKMAIFPSETIVQASISKTATEAEITLDAVNDTLFPYGRKYSNLWRFCTRYIAIYSDNYDDGIEIYHEFPNDLKLKSKDSLLLEAKLAKESGLNQNVINAWNDDILEAHYTNDKDTFEKLKIQNKFMPFSGKSETEIAVILSGDVIPDYKTLYIYFDSIFEDIVNEEPNFYILPYSKQKDIVSKKVEEYQAQIPTISNVNINDLLDELNGNS